MSDGCTNAFSNDDRLICAVLYWYMWLVLLPRWRGYRVEEKTNVLEDGTSVVRLVRVKVD